MLKLNKRQKKNLYIYAICIIVYIVSMLLFNYVLKIPEIISVVGDKNTWLPIIADAVISAIIFITGNSIINKDKLRNIISDKKNDYSIICKSVCRVQSALNIKRRQLCFIYSLDINMNSRSLLSEIMNVQQEIDDSVNAFEQIKYIIVSKPELEKFEETYNQMKNTFQTILDELMNIVNNWCDLQAKSAQANTVTDLICKDSDKTIYAKLYALQCDELEKCKEKFLGTYKSKENTLDILIKNLSESVNNLLTAESKIIEDLELNL